MSSRPGGVLVIYTGGTIGSVRSDPRNPDSPLVPGSAARLMERLPLEDGRMLPVGARRVPVEVICLDPPVDSSLIRPRDWLRMAEVIEENHDRYDGFVILHGTDTMAFTASALSFMFENLDRPIVLTGSQRPIGASRSDALQNVETAVEIAAAAYLGADVVPEVTIFFRDKLLRGCRVTKRSADSFDAFHTPNLPPLGMAGEKIEIRTGLLRPARAGRLRVHRDLDEGIAVLELSPLMSFDMLGRLLEAEGLHGVILKTYGAGNAPDDPVFLEILSRAVSRGIRIVAVTQCDTGMVNLGLYQVSVGLLEAGVLSGLDMTAEAAQTKLSVLLGDSSLADRVEDLISIDLRGELDFSMFGLGFPGGTARPTGTVGQEGAFPAPGRFSLERLKSARLHVIGMDTEGADSLEVGLDAGDPARDWIRVPLGNSTHRSLPLILDVLHLVRSQLDPQRRTRITLRTRGGGSLSWKRLKLTMLTDP